MKLKHIAVSLALIGTAFGGSVTVTNNTGASSQSVLDNAGNPVDGGYAAIGTVNEAALATLSSGVTWQPLSTFLEVQPPLVRPLA